MINLNSPTVQFMLSNTPQGFGNLPAYFGNNPTVTTETVSSTQTPFPSPKDMVMQTGQQNIYGQTSFAPRNIVGGYNPGYQSAFGSYSNPYMAYGYPYGYYGLDYYQNPIDQDSQDRLESAILNGLTYDEQLVEESNLYKTLSKIVSKNIGRTEEESNECAAAFDIYCKYPKKEEIKRKEIKPLHIVLKIGDEVVADMDPEKIVPKQINHRSNINYVQQMEYRQAINEIEKVKRNNILYDNAIERKLDSMDLFDFFNTGIGMLLAEDQKRTLYAQSITRTAQTYDRDNFKKRLLEKNGLRSRDQLKAAERFAGRYGILPNGMPVSPQHDPSIAECFSYDSKTGSYSVTAPNFLRDRMERARESFIRSTDSN